MAEKDSMLQAKNCIFHDRHLEKLNVDTICMNNLHAKLLASPSIIDVIDFTTYIAVEKL